MAQDISFLLLPFLTETVMNLSRGIRQMRLVASSVPIVRSTWGWTAKALAVHTHGAQRGYYSLVNY